MPIKEDCQSTNVGSTLKTAKILNLTGPLAIVGDLVQILVGILSRSYDVKRVRAISIKFHISMRK